MAHPQALVPGIVVFRPPRRVAAANDLATGGVTSPARVGATPKDLAARSRDGSAYRWCTSLGGCRRLRTPGRASACRPRPNGSLPPAAACRRDLLLGRRVPPFRAVAGQYLAGRVPLAEPCAGRVSWARASRLVSREWLWPVRYGRQCLAMDQGLVRCWPCSKTPTSPAARLGTLAASPSRQSTTRRRRATRCPKGDQGRLSISARRTTANATVPRRAIRRRSTRPPAT